MRRETIYTNRAGDVIVTRDPVENLLPFALEVQLEPKSKRHIQIAWYETEEEARSGMEALLRAIAAEEGGIDVDV